MYKIFLLLCSFFLLGGQIFAISQLEPTNHTILTTEETSIITPPESNAIRQGTRDAIHSESHQYQINNLLETQQSIESQNDATQRTLQLIHKLINYALSLVSFIALIVLIFAGVQMVTAGGDDGKFKTGIKTLKKVAIAIIGIGISWMIVSLIFWFLGTIS